MTLGLMVDERSAAEFNVRFISEINGSGDDGLVDLRLS